MSAGAPDPQDEPDRFVEEYGLDKWRINFSARDLSYFLGRGDVSDDTKRAALKWFAHRDVLGDVEVLGRAKEGLALDIHPNSDLQNAALRNLLVDRMLQTAPVLKDTDWDKWTRALQELDVPRNPRAARAAARAEKDTSAPVDADLLERIATIHDVPTLSEFFHRQRDTRYARVMLKWLAAKHYLPLQDLGAVYHHPHETKRTLGEHEYAQYAWLAKKLVSIEPSLHVRDEHLWQRTCESLDPNTSSSPASVHNPIAVALAASDAASSPSSSDDDDDDDDASSPSSDDTSWEEFHTSDTSSDDDLNEEEEDKVRAMKTKRWKTRLQRMHHFAQENQRKRRRRRLVLLLACV